MTAEEARSVLRDQLLDLSEAAMSAQWYGDLEFILWDRLGRGASRLGNVQLDDELLNRLGELSLIAGGWFIYSEGAEGRTGAGVLFIEERDWKREFDCWLARVPEHARPRDR